MDPALQAKELVAQTDPDELMAVLAVAQAAATGPTDLLRRIGVAALAAETVSEVTRREVIVSRLPSADWPMRPLKIVAVDTATGERAVFDSASGVGLIDAVAASCAVPLIWPAVTIGSKRYMDGGVYSIENADLAIGCDLALILSPGVAIGAPHTLKEQVEQLEAAGTRVVTILIDEASTAAMASIGANPLDPAMRGPAAKAGREQGRREAAKLAALWT